MNIVLLATDVCSGGIYSSTTELKITRIKYTKTNLLNNSFKKKLLFIYETKNIKTFKTNKKTQINK